MKQLPLALAFVAVLLVPVLLRPKTERAAGQTETVVIVTPHNEAIRYEFARAFEEHYLEKTGKRVRVDYRTPGGTTEIGRYIAGEFVAAFENHWTRSLRRPWSSEVERAFANTKQQPDETTPAGRAREAFLGSNVGCKIDLFFGGGTYDFQQAAAAGYLVDSGYVRAHPEMFNDGAIPQNLSGEPFWDRDGRWIGTCVSAFGIVYNTDVLRRLGIDEPPRQWADLADPRYFGQIALANPTQSGAISKAFEMLIQQQMLEAVREQALVSPEAESKAVGDGWLRGLRMLQNIAANARYVTDSSSKIVLDVTSGDCAAGMAIDFYGRFQNEAVAKADGSSRIQYVNAEGGTSIGADSIGMYRGAPNANIAREFIAFVMSEKGQKLWNWKLGTPDGPKRYALRRLPILPAIYAEEMKSFRSDPEVNPYAVAKTFTYHPEWTGPLFRAIGFVFRVMCIEPHEELVSVRRAYMDAGLPQRLTEGVRMDVVDYASARGRIREALSSSKISEVKLARELADHFRGEYERIAGETREKPRKETIQN